MKNNKLPFKCSVTFLLCLMLSHLFLYFFRYKEYDIFLKVKDYGQELMYYTFLNVDRNIRIISIVYLILLLGFIIAFLIWFSRAYKNLDYLSINRRYKFQQAIYSWFIPFFNLIRPFEIMKDLIEKTEEVLSNGNIIFKKIPIILVITWWIPWIGGSIVSSISSRMPTDTIEEVIQKGKSLLYASPLLIIAEILLLLIIVKYHSMEMQLRNVALQFSEENHSNEN